MTPEEELAAMLDPLDYPGVWTEREKNAYTAKREALHAQITTQRHAAEHLSLVARTWAALELELGRVTAARKDLTAIRARLDEERAALPAFPRSRREEEYRQNLDLSIESIDSGLRKLDGASSFTLRSLRLGEMLIAAGYASTNDAHRQFGGIRWPGTLPELEKEIQDLTKRRDAARDEYRPVEVEIGAGGTAL
jgi:predicted  nucleic acid-binding Zn-ribbon protein